MTDALWISNAVLWLLVVGLSLVIPAAVIEAWRTRPPVDPRAPALAHDDESWERWNPWLAREVEPDEDDA